MRRRRRNVVYFNTINSCTHIQGMFSNENNGKIKWWWIGKSDQDVKFVLFKEGFKICIRAAPNFIEFNIKGAYYKRSAKF